MSLGVDLGRAQ